VTLNLPVI